MCLTLLRRLVGAGADRRRLCVVLGVCGIVVVVARVFAHPHHAVVCKERLSAETASVLAAGNSGEKEARRGHDAARHGCRTSIE